MDDTRTKKGIQSLEDAANQTSGVDNAYKQLSDWMSNSGTSSKPAMQNTYNNAAGYANAQSGQQDDETRNATQRLSDLHDQMDWASDEDKPSIQKQIDDVKSNFPKITAGLGN